MPKINVKEPFAFSPDGKSVVDVEVGEQEVSERCAEVAVEHLKVASLVKGKPKPEKESAEKAQAGTGDA